MLAGSRSLCRGVVAQGQEGDSGLASREAFCDRLVGAHFYLYNLTR